LLTAGPGETVTIAQSGIPTGQVVGYQVIKAVSGSVAIGRTTTGVVERPAGSGNYVATFVAPVEVDLYLIVIDWNAGVITTTKSKVEELQITSAVAQAATGLGLVGDYAKANLGGETFQLLLESANYGSGYVDLAIQSVEARVVSATLDEATLPVAVLSYLGKLVALELMPAAIDLWNNRPQSRSIPSEPGRDRLLPVAVDDAQGPGRPPAGGGPGRAGARAPAAARRAPERRLVRSGDRRGRPRSRHARPAPVPA
jgi:hypothetical protein